MPFPVLPLPLAFTLPSIAGVPDVIGRVVPSQVTSVISTSLAAIYDEWSLETQKRQWGFFKPASVDTSSSGKTTTTSNDTAILTSSSVYSIELDENYAVSSAPQEDGAFISYNKVKLPISGTVRLVCDGFQSGSSLLERALGKSEMLWNENNRPTSIRTKFLEELATIVANTNLYKLKMPEKTWERVNITGYHITRSADQPFTILFVDVHFVEIRSVNTQTTKVAAKPQGAKVADSGIMTAMLTDLEDWFTKLGD